MILTVDFFNDLIIYASRYQWGKMSITLGRATWDEVHHIAHTGMGGNSGHVIRDWLELAGWELVLHPTIKGDHFSMEPIS